jgi:hypothetical protein
MRTPLAALMVVCLFVGCGQAPVDIADAPRTGPYLGEEPPGDTPLVFAKGFVSTQLNQRDTAWSPEGDGLFYSLWARNRGVIVTVRRTDGVWSQPEIAPISGIHSDLEPFISPDGKALYFVSKRPLVAGGEEKDWDIWVARRTETGWSEPENLGAPVNTERNEFYPSLTRDGTIYFTADGRPDSLGGEDLYRSRLADGVYTEPENLGPAVNSPGPEFNSLISPDENWLIFGSVRQGDHGGGDLYVSFRGDDGSWTEAQSMPSPINTAALDFCPALSPDGKFFFFSSQRVPDYAATPTSYDELVSSMSGVFNGSMNLYWVDAGVIEALRAVGQ